jgi:RND family efflux transporter MFP subunit
MQEEKRESSCCHSVWRRVIHPLWILAIVLSTSFPASSAEKLAYLRPYQRELSLTGFTRPRQTVTVTSEVSARCLLVAVEVGDRIDRSGLLAELDTTFVRLELAKNSVAQQKAARQLELEKKTVARYNSLIDQRSAAQATYDEASLKADVLELTVSELKIEATRLSEMLKRHTLKGPPGWEVMERYVEPGEYIQQGAPVVRLGDFSSLLVPFLLTRQEVALLQEEATIDLHCPDLGDRVAGRIHTIGPGFDEKSRKIPVEILVDGSTEKGDHFLRGGMRVLLKLAGRTEKDLFVVPTKALVSRYDAHWLLTQEGHRVKVIVLGENGEGGYATITGNSLKAGDAFLAQPEEAGANDTGIKGR